MTDNKTEITFYNWVIRLKNLNSPTGDIANDIVRDKCCSCVENNLQAYVDHLRYHNACKEAIAALKAAWKSYKAYLKSHSNG